MKKAIVPLSQFIMYVILVLSGVLWEESAQCQSTAENLRRWPTTDPKAGIVLAFGEVVNPRTNTQVFNEGYYIATQYHSPVIALTDGRILMATPYVWYSPNLNYQMSFGGPPDPQFLRAKNLEPAYVAASVGLQVSQTETLYYTGLLTELKVKPGQRVKAGDTLGFSGYTRWVTDQPALGISLSKGGKTSDVGVYLFGPDYKPKEIKKSVPYNPWAKLSPEKLREDFSILRASLEEGHPGIYLYSGKQEMDRWFDSIASVGLNTQLPLNSFAAIVRKTLARVRCGHTNFIEPGYENKNYCPLDIRFADGKCLVKKDWNSPSVLKPGTELLTVNGFAPDSLFRLLAQQAESDGYSVAGRQYLVNRLSRIFLHNEFGDVSRWSLTIKTPEGSTRQVSIPSISWNDLRKKKTEAMTKKPDPLPDAVKISFDSSGLACLKVIDFALFDRDQIDGFLAQLAAQKVTKLLIDLRDNPGGTTENLDYLYAYFAGEPFRMIEYDQVFKAGKFDFLKYSTNYSGDDDMHLNFNKVEGYDGYIHVPDLVEPRKENHFDGKVWVLMNGGTFSAASIFCARMALDKRAVLLGEETGGAFHQLTAEKFAYIRLKNSGFMCRIPMVRSVVVSGNSEHQTKGRGVLPDVVVVPTVSQLLGDTFDGVMQQAVEIISQAP
ncbi:MAG: S41 family peptidase [Bacteroidales bacterium]|nr:S41 family peptidase [Bacteroidales bacterium]